MATLHKTTHGPCLLVLPLFATILTTSIATTASAQPIGPPIVVQRQLQLDAPTTSVRIHNLRADRVDAFSGFGTAGGFCELDALECTKS